MLYQSGKSTLRHFSKAFTVVEVGIIIPIVLVVIGAFILTIINFTTQALDARKDNAVAVEAQNALNRMADDVAGSIKFLATNDFTVASPQGVGNNTVKFTATSQALILQTPLTASNPRTASASVDNFVYKPNSPLACSDPNVANNTLSTYNIVYFVQGSTIARRSMMPTDWNGNSYACNGANIWQKPTCAPGQSGANCSGGNDEIVSGKFQLNGPGISISYFNEGTAIPDSDVFTGSAASKQAALDQATSAKVTIQTSFTDGDNNQQTYRTERILPLK